MNLTFLCLRDLISFLQCNSKQNKAKQAGFVLMHDYLCTWVPLFWDTLYKDDFLYALTVAETP